MSRVAERVERGGHNIPVEIIRRRYFRGIYNLLKLYIPICDIWTVLNNMSAIPEEIASGYADVETIIINPDIWDEILHQGNHHE